MKKIKLFKNIILIVLISTFSACGLTDFYENLNDPNEVTVENLDIDLLMNKVLTDYGYFAFTANRPSMELTRMMAMTSGDAYQRAHDFSGTDGLDLRNLIWDRAYTDVIVQADQVIESGNKTELFTHVGVAKIVKGITMLTLVDLFGDVPFSEAGKGVTGNFNPKVDNGADVYTGAIALLDEGIAELAKTAKLGLSRDIYYGGNKARWTALANTMKLKAYMNLRLVNQADSKAKIEALLKADIIDTPAEDFTYKYGTSDVPGISRAFHYRNMYDPVAGSATGYIGNYFMKQVYNGKGIEDPRWRYYFFRQVGSKAKASKDEPEAIPCGLTPKAEWYLPEHPWCTFEPGFYGRDHGNNDGTPPDSRAITCVGVYPYGGLADTNDGDAEFQKITKQGDGANGAGIEPIWMSSFTDFVKAEAALTLGIGGDAEAKAALLAGVKNSIESVQNFGKAKGQVVPAAMTPSTDVYLAKVAELYDASADKLDVAMREYYIALWGNGMESYNMYRRTGKPARIQPMRAQAPGKFLYSLLYPSEFANLNSNATQKPVDGVNKVFWDKNGDILY